MFLLDHPNPHGRNFYPTRRGSILAVVLHVTAGLQGMPAGADRSAEATAQYAAATDRQVSWHSGSDRDSFLQLLPDSYTAFHCIGYNSRTVGHEISKTDVTWLDEDPTWTLGTLMQATACLRPRVSALGIPLRHASKAELDHAIATDGKPVGFIGHSELDPQRRRDPGPDFPWHRFLALLAAGSAQPVDRGLTVGMRGQDVKNVQHALAVAGNKLIVDGVYGPRTAAIVRLFQQRHHLIPTGVVDAATWAALRAIPGLHGAA